MRVRVASAGTGKTTSLVLRLLQAVADGVPLRRIAAVTYTRSAAAELRERVGDGLAALLRDGHYLGGALTLEAARRERFEEAARELGGARMTTIHGFMRWMLRLVAPSLAIDPEFSAYGEAEALASFEEALLAQLFLAQDPRATLAEPLRRLGVKAQPWATELFKRRAVAPDVRPSDPLSEDLWQVFSATYDDWLRRVGPARLAPSEIELQALRLVATPALAARVVARTPLLLVDEYQDVNPAQGRLFEALEGAGARVEVVGDPKQAIYGFRFADVEVFRRAAAAADLAGTLDEPLVNSRRHAPEVAHFLNHMTRTLAEAGLGFDRGEAPDVQAVVSEGAPVAGASAGVELHWWRDDERRLEELRASELTFIAERLEALHQEEGVPYRDMALIARSHATLERAVAALQARGVPAVLRQGRGFFTRPELRDLRAALAACVTPAGTPLAAFLRGPFAGLSAEEAAAVARAEAPIEALAERHPAFAERFEALRRTLRSDPGRALAHLAYRQLAAGVPFVARLSKRARENVDALVVAFAERPPADLERALDAFDRFARESESGDVPQGGDGVTLLTVHASKGLEWPVVAVVDAGARAAPRTPDIAVDPELGTLAHPGAPPFEALEERRKAREAGEIYRLLYVALSRPRRRLMVSGSQGISDPGPWLAAFHRAMLGPVASVREAEAARVAHALGVERVLHKVRGVQVASLHEQPAPLAPPAAPAPTPTRPRFPALVSPSWVILEGAGRAPEPRVRAPWPAPLHAPGDVEEGALLWDGEGGERFAGRATAVGILVHDAIARGRVEAGAARTLAGQEVLFSFPPSEHPRILAEVEELLSSFRTLVAAGAIPALGQPEVDARELPFAFEGAGSTWQGVIDRFWIAGGAAWVDDFKTDRTLDASRYRFSMATYVEATERARGVRPGARLIDLRRSQVVELDDADLRAAWVEQVGGMA